MRAARAFGAAALSPWEVALLIAIGGHGAALALAWRGWSDAPLVARAAFAREERPFDVAVEVVEDRPNVASGEATGSPPARGASIAARDEPRTPGRGERGPPVPEAPTPSGDVDGPRGSNEYDALPARPEALPGLGGAPVWSLPGVLPPGARPAPAPTTIPRARFDPDAAGRVLRGTLDARDQERGLSLPAANEAARAIEAVVASAETTGESKATFTVELDASGNVTSVALATTTAGDARTWAAVVARIKAALAGRRLTMRGRASRLGARVTIEVVTRERFPNGAAGAGATNVYGEHKSRTVLSRARVTVAGEKALPEDVKPIVDQPFFRPPDPHQSGVVPVNPGDEYRRRPGE